VRVAAVARTSRARLVAILSASTHDIAAAEDALSDAIEAALSAWGTAGVPDNAEAWLLTVARNKLRDRFRSSAVRKSVEFDEAAAAAVPAVEADRPVGIEDKRLELMFVCAHPAIDPTVRTPLMLQVVLGLDAKQIGAAFAVPATTMGQRLVRAKRRIRDARIPFTIPERDALAARLDAVLEAVYGAFAIDWRGIAGVTERDSLSGEALYLARTLTELLPDDPEVLGLNALIALSAARARARVRDGMLVPVNEQDPALWDEPLIEEGEALLGRAHRLGRPGRFQLEAATQSVHCHRRMSGKTDWATLEVLYRALLDVAPTLGAAVSLAAVIGETNGSAAGLQFLESIEAPNVGRFQPAWATRAHLLARAGDHDRARHAYDRAVALATDPPMRRFLEMRRAQLQAP
jgi:RNA polymerase sigma-70 factor (ECF subfamily)